MRFTVPLMQKQTNYSKGVFPGPEFEDVTFFPLLDLKGGIM